MKKTVLLLALGLSTGIAGTLVINKGNTSQSEITTSTRSDNSSDLKKENAALKQSINQLEIELDSLKISSTAQSEQVRELQASLEESQKVPAKQKPGSPITFSNKGKNKVIGKKFFEKLREKNLKNTFSNLNKRLNFSPETSAQIEALLRAETEKNPWIPFDQSLAKIQDELAKFLTADEEAGLTAYLEKQELQRLEEGAFQGLSSVQRIIDMDDAQKDRVFDAFAELEAQKLPWKEKQAARTEALEGILTEEQLQQYKDNTAEGVQIFSGNGFSIQLGQ